MYLGALVSEGFQVSHLDPQLGEKGRLHVPPLGEQVKPCIGVLPEELEIDCKPSHVHGKGAVRLPHRVPLVHLPLAVQERALKA